MQIAPGRRVALNGVEWTIEDVHGQHGRLVLVDTDGRTETRSFRWLINHGDLRLLPTAEASGRPSPVSRQPRTLADLTKDQLERARLRLRMSWKPKPASGRATRLGPCRVSPGLPTIRTARR
ncbi:hypothetical protein [Streptomyces sp. NPDC053079]|uniref:hypothetical protein n=1 Tax=Streptomyces sp. NPDC053079 TaxID=3365697 RepID=UPI0037D46B38